MKEKKFDKQKLLTTVVTVILVFFFIGGFWIGLDRVRSMEGTFPPNDLKESITPAPESADEAFDYLKNLLDKAIHSNPALSYDGYFSIPSDSLETDGSDTFKATLLFALDNFRNHISAVEESEDKISSVNFGEDISSLLMVPDYENMKVTDFTCSYIYYSCPSCGVTSDEQLSSCEPCGSEREYFKKYRGEYDIELTVEPLDISTDKIFSPRTDEEISALTESVIKDAVNVNNTEISYNQYKIYFKVNRLTDEIITVRYIKEMSVNADVSFIGNYSAVGNKSVSFNVSETDRFDFTWPALSLNTETLVIEPKKSDNLLATLTCENPLDMTVIWTSSDESVATVDKDGYVYAEKTTGETVITASFEYLGKTYSDSCTVYVRVPVESMKMSKKSVKLDVGDTFTLETKVSPSKATVQTVKWYSEDESIAVVDINGVVTAKEQGEVIVYAISDDGYFRSTCEVTVK